MTLRAALSLALVAALAACGAQPAESSGADTSSGSGSGCAPGPTSGDLPCEVDAVLESKCQTCHADPPQHGAPFPLVTYADTQQKFGITEKRRWQVMAEVVEPDGDPHMPYGDAPQLTGAELEALRAWFSACAPPRPEGKSCDPGMPICSARQCGTPHSTPW